MFNVINSIPYLRTSRHFPEDAENLSQELDKSYIEIAQNVNARIIGLFAINRPSITGESWFLNTQRMQTLRQVYLVPPAATTGTLIPLGFKINNISQFSHKCYGTFTNGVDWFGLIFASSTAIAGQVSFYMQTDTLNPETDNIVIVVDAGAPAITYGTITIEWLSNV
jgi:hypothetical protein